MTDPTLAALAKFDDRDHWADIVPNVPIFVEHSIKTRTANGTEKTITVDEARLRRIAANIVKAERENGVVLKFFDGHTADPKSTPQAQQPPILAYGRGATVGRWGPQQKLGILTTMYVRKGCGSVVSMRPHRSAEFYDSTDEITAVALLATDPRLDMGMVFYDRREDGGYSLYLENRPMADEKPGETPPEKKPEGEQPPADGANMDDTKKKEFMTYMAACYPKLDEMHQKYMAAISGTNAQGPPQPNQQQPPNQPPNQQPPMKKEPAQMAREDLPEQYAKLEAEHGVLKTEVATLRESLQAEQYARAKSESQAAVNELARDGYKLPDAAKEVERLAKLDAAGRVERIAEIRTCYQRLPVGGPIRLADVPAGGEPTEREVDAAMQYTRDHPGTSYEDAIAKVRGKAA